MSSIIISGNYSKVNFWNLWVVHYKYPTTVSGLFGSSIIISENSVVYIFGLFGSSTVNICEHFKDSLGRPLCFLNELYIADSLGRPPIGLLGLSIKFSKCFIGIGLLGSSTKLTFRNGWWLRRNWGINA